MRYAVGCPTFTWRMPHYAYKDRSSRVLVGCFIFLQATKNPTLSNRVSLIRSHGALRSRMSYFHMANATLSSALFRFTTEFGMGSGGSKTLLSPSVFCLLIALAIN